MFYKIRATSWLAEQSVDPKEGICYVQLVSTLLTEVLSWKIFIINFYVFPLCLPIEICNYYQIKTPM